MSETATADAPVSTADAPAQTPVEPVKSAESVAPEPWYSKYKPADEDAKILGKYKDEADAIKSIGFRERAFHSRVELPKSGAKPEDTVKAHRGILEKMGAPKDVTGYRPIVEAAKERVPSELKAKLGDTWFDECCADAARIGMLPWQFEDALNGAIRRAEDGVRSQEAAALSRQDDLEKSLKVRYGLQWGKHATNAELVAKHLDDFLTENNKGLSVGEDGQPIKDAFTRRMKAYNDPVLYATFDHLFDILLSEGDGGPRRLGGKAEDGYAKAFEYAKTNYAASGPEYWARYAKENVGRFGGEA